MTNGLNIMPSFNSLVAGAKAAISLPLGLTYERLELFVNVDGTPRDLPTSEFGDYFGEVRLLVDGRPKIRIDMADLTKLNAFYRREDEAGVSALYLSAPEMRTPEGEDYYGYGTAGGSVQSMQFEIELKAGKTFNTVELYALQTPGRPLGSHYGIDRYTVQPNATGKKQVTIPRDNYALKGLHLGSNAVSNVLIEANQRRLIDVRRQVLNHVAKNGKRTPQATMTHVDFQQRNRLAESLLMDLSDFRLEYEFTATGNYDLYVEKAMSAGG